MEEAAEDTVKASQIAGAARLAETLGVAPIIKEAARKVEEAP